MKHEFARYLRRNQTDVERKLWRALRNRRFAQFKFRRQQPIGPFIVDFVCFERWLIIELDGSQHNAEVDAKREAYLRGRGYRIKRYWNSELIQYFDSVLDDIYREMTVRPLTRPQSLEPRLRPTLGPDSSAVPRGPRPASGEVDGVQSLGRGYFAWPLSRRLILPDGESWKRK